MNSVLGFAELLVDTNLDEDQRNFVDLINRNANALLNIINDILDFSRIESGRLELDQEPFDVEATAIEALESVRLRAEDDPVKISFHNDSPSAPTRMEGDHDRLRQILLNLLSNAIKFTSEGSVTLRMSIEEPDSDALHTIHFQVTDTGIGISPDRVKQLFQPFTQADRSISKRFGGTGLGLAISQRLCRLMGGEICVESVEGKGSTFSFHIRLPEADSLSSLSNIEPPEEYTRDPYEESPKLEPLPEPEVEAELEAKSDLIDDTEEIDEKASGDSAQQLDLSTNGSLKILLAEDNSANQLVIKKMLARLDLVPEIATNGSQAIDLWRARKHDLIFMDLQMPVLDGIEATRRIRSLERSSHSSLDARLRGESRRKTVIIAITANALRGDRERCLEAGMNDYLSKPIKISNFVEAVSKYFPEMAKS
ncbi:MAG: ATP-binding protein, partial [Verrucomicrobiota bacterium]